MASGDLDGGLRGRKDRVLAVVGTGRRRGGELRRDREDEYRGEERAEPDCGRGRHLGINFQDSKSVKNHLWIWLKERNGAVEGSLRRGQKLRTVTPPSLSLTIGILRQFQPAL